MRVGVLMLPTDRWPETVRRARRIEELGYAGIWTYDHLSWQRYRDKPWFGAMAWLTGLAGVTDRVRLGTMVSAPNFHHPVTLGKEAMTLDHVSGGRFTLGLGAGGIGYDATVFGGEPLSPKQRADRLTEFVEAIDQLLRQPFTSYAGEYYTIDEAQMLPGCVQRPRLPLAIAASGKRTLKLAARYAEEWITHGDPADETVAGTERAVRDQIGRLTDECVALGRDPAELRRIYLIGVTDDRPLDSVAAFTDFVNRYRELGVSDLVFHHPRPDDPVWTEPEEIVERIAVEVLPTL